MKERDKAKYNAYMREYMHKRIAKMKEDSPQEYSDVLGRQRENLKVSRHRRWQEHLNQAKKYAQMPKGKYRVYKGNAKARNLVFNLTLEQFMEYWQKPCFYCGDAIETIGLDRVDNTLGYSADNIVSCCATCNNMKKNLPQDVFIHHCQKITKFNSCDYGE